MKKITTLYQDPSPYLNKIIKKDYFKEINSFIKNKKINSILDIGCASGAFAYHLNKNIQYLGLDISNPLLKMARKINKKNKHYKFKNLNLFDCNNKNFKKLAKKNFKGNFDLITLLGTLTSFSNANSVIKRLLSLNPKFLILHSPLNEKTNSSVKFYYKNKKKIIKGQLHIISKQYINQILGSKYSVKFKKYKLKTSLKKNDKNLLRNYHINFNKNKNLTTNDIGVLYHEYLVYIKYK